ncbi:dual specificity phosphatase 19 [Clonorchis sinensis]|uniref:Dual specificity protein phosphatase 19 n=2 Tax=Clonorchis sinensis TaxID=79923 RepID=G7YVK3_CLOSI|nr:dual specificity phosphatase 19 [Clonorchis sinensis]GAA56983.1 dual specificity protein phosphatase 19 [Clonorchis sinensis]
MNLRNAIKDFNPRTLRSTLVHVRNLDGSVVVTDKRGNIITHRGRSEDSEPNFSQYGFIPNPNPDLQVGSQDVARDLNCLQSNGVTHVINLVSNIVPNLYPHLFDYLSLVLYDDMHFPLGDSIRQCVNYLERVRRAGGVCFVHCDVGRCRAPSMVIAYLIKVEDYSYERAYTEVNNARNVAINLNFKMQLMSLA